MTAVGESNLENNRDVMKISLKDFVLTGLFGPVTIGMPIDEVTSILGEPTFRRETQWDFKFINYGWYEFFFFEDSLYSIQNDNVYNPYLFQPELYEFRNLHFEIDPWLFRTRPWHTFTTTIQLLGEARIPYHLEDYYGRTLIWLASKVYFDFEADEGDDPPIIGIRYYPNSSSPF